ncbi:hypothetical protein FSP39_009640, partial [Pinctada imbricata]
LDQTPGKPVARKCKSDSITLSWRVPNDFQEGDYYQIRFKNIDGGKWRFYEEQPSEGSIVMTKMKANTKFVFQVRVVHDDMEGPYSPVSDEVHTKLSPANRLFSYSTLTRKGTPDLYRLPLTENKNARNSGAKTRKFDLGAPPKRGEEKTIMLVGATGTGKSTLVDGLVNYVLGVNWDDSFRYTLVDLEKEERSKQHNQALSQTEWITCYSINMEEGSRLNYRLNVIDTPGFGDTRGLERDQMVVDQIRELFSAKGEQGVVFIDAVCFLIKAPDARLTAVQKYIFHSIMSLFGNDIEQNICTMITFADGDDPPVLAALEEAQLPFGKWFPFNNSGLFANNKVNENVRMSLTPMFWEMGLKSFSGFFKQLENMETKSLQLTKQVLTQRQLLELTIQNLQPQVDAGLSKLNELTAEIQIIDQHKTDIDANKNFTYKVTETKQVKHDLPKGQHVTNCLNCHVTCHKNCMIPKDEDKAGCSAMDGNGNCTQCQDNCNWTQHANTPYIFEYIQEESTKTYQEKLEKYKRAEGEKMTHEKVVERMEEELHDLMEEIHEMMTTVKECNNILKEIALRPNPLSMVEHIDMLIESEKMEKRIGFNERITVLKQFRKKAEIGKDVDRFRQGVQSARKARYGGSSVKAEVVRQRGGFRKAFNKFTNFFS